MNSSESGPTSGAPSSSGPQESSPAPAAAPKKPSLLLPAIKLLLAGGLLYYVFSTKINAESKKELHGIFLESPFALMIAVAAFSSQLFIGAQRLRLLLRPQGVQLKYLNALRLTYLGAFFDTFMVTSVGGDAIKAIYLARETPKGRKLEAVSVLLLDRLLGLLGLLTLMVAMTLLHYQQLSADKDIQPLLKWLFLAPAFFLTGTGMLLSGRVYNSVPMQFMLKKMPLGQTVDRAYGSLQKFRNLPHILLLGWLLSICVHFFGVICGYALVNGMGETHGFGKFLVAWFICNFVVSFAPAAGIGVGQAVYDPIFLKIADVKHGWVLATAVQATSIMAKSPGLIAWLASREQAPVSGSDPQTVSGDAKGETRA
ncbi:MAG TPA: lysylphosphatidylglycerol synthase domain-containing protein [Planctomycetota bacterium]|nr:lysylphosphatidylglycerol synthase domain-containing protein [Planctomycetota bacterium]